MAHGVQRPIVSAMIPMVRWTLDTVQSDFLIQSLEIAEDGPNQTLRLRANLSQPVEIGGRTFYPIGYLTRQVGGYQATLTTGGVIVYSLVTLIVVLTWPALQWKEMLKRFAIALPLMVLLILINVGVTFPAELWTPIHNEWVPDVRWPLLEWSKLLMGGAGLAMGLVCGAMAIWSGQVRAEVASPVFAP